ncbi:hypothetical protein D3C76_1858500 [compost metagenome]
MWARLAADEPIVPEAAVEPQTPDSATVPPVDAATTTPEAPVDPLADRLPGEAITSADAQETC